MKTFKQYIFEATKSDFIFAFDMNKDMSVANIGNHEDAFPELYFAKESQRLPTDNDAYASAWGRVQNGVMSLTTQHGRTPLAEYQAKKGIRMTKDAIDDIFHRIHAVKEISKKYPDIQIHAGSEFNSPIYHTPEEHLKYLTGLIS